MIANFVSGAANRAGDRRQPPTSAPHGTNIAGMPAPGEGFENRRRTLARPIVEGERESPASRVSAIGIAPDAVRPEAQKRVRLAMITNLVSGAANRAGYRR